MLTEITTPQAREVAALRGRWPGADVITHQRPWGVILEVRRGGHVCDVVALHADGSIEAAGSLRRAA